MSYTPEPCLSQCPARMVCIARLHDGPCNQTQRLLAQVLAETRTQPVPAVGVWDMDPQPWYGQGHPKESST
jgi:hypothetical protein